MLDQVTTTLPTGVTVLLGPNGAGKSSLMLAICGLIPIDSGTVTWNGEPTDRGDHLQHFRQSLGWMPQNPGFPPRLRVNRFLESAAWLKSVDADAQPAAVAHALETVDLTDFADRTTGKLSGGESQRLALGAALVADPGLIILDEPTAGFDPDQRALFHRTLRDLGRGRVVLVSTHLLEDVEGIADRVTVIHRGRSAFTGSVQDFVGRTGSTEVSLQTLRQAWTMTITGTDEAA
ncbi:MAG: ATP-binding cassette domain-containing protein [Actinomycetia bacterium]|nr:ATP-binding cassette domain-containing protein [Actinomycetes bacterium]